MAATRQGASMEDLYGNRLSHLEGQVGGITAQVTNLSGSLVELGHKIDRIVDKMGQKEQVNWGWITTGIVTLGAFIMLYTQPLAKENDVQSADLKAITLRQYEIREEQVRAHSASDARIKDLERRVTSLEEGEKGEPR